MWRYEAAGKENDEIMIFVKEKSMRDETSVKKHIVRIK